MVNKEEITCNEDNCKIITPKNNNINISLPNTLEELLEPRPGKEIVAIIKRNDSIPVPFERDMISSAVSKASKASGKNYDSGIIEEITSEVENKLKIKRVFEHSEITIPHVEDIQDIVLEVFNERNARNLSSAISSRLNLPLDHIYSSVIDSIKNFDSTGEFYKRYREQRSAVREKLINLPIDMGIDSTDKQLQIGSLNNGKSHKFDANLLMKFILDKTKVKYDDAYSTVKRVEEVLANRKGNKTVEKEELFSIIDASLMERGYSKNDVLGGRALSFTLDDLDQLIVNKSNENSNIKINNPEAVNLGIAELVLKEKALREIFDTDVSEAHKNGEIHIHDLGYPIRVYCSAHSVEYIKKYGLDKIVANLDAKSTPAKAPQVLNNHLHTFLAAIQSSYAGALGFPMLNTLYGPALLKEIEMVEGNQIIRDEKGKIIKKIPMRLKKNILEDLLLSDYEFEKTNSIKILEEYSKKEMKQITQNLVFGASQSAFSRGGQTLFIDFNIDLDIPPYVAEVPALFLGAEYVKVKKNKIGEWELIEKTKEEPKRYEGLMVNKGHKDKQGKIILEPDNKNGDVIQPEDGLWVTYGHELIKNVSLKFAESLLEVSAEGDRYKNMFNFPKIDVHVSKETFENPESDALLKKACEVVEKNDSVYFMYDRGDGMNVSQCCRLRERITDPAILKHPEKMRFCGFQNVSINLPQAAFRSNGATPQQKFDSFLKEIDTTMLLALKAHTNKRRYIQYLFDTDGSPMRAMGGIPSDDGEPYIDLTKSTYIFGLVGLNEAVQHITGKQMDEDAQSYQIGLDILSHVYSIKNEFTKRYGMKFVIEETPGESANRRLAKLDLINYPNQAKEVLKGSFEKDEIYYTNSSHIRADASISGLDRTILQSKMNPMIEAGAITHVFTGEKNNNATAVYDFVKAIYNNTQSSQVVFSGEHTVCLCCGTHFRGLKEKCTNCGNDNPKKISQKTRVVGYFSDPRAWNKSKQGELIARQNSKEYYTGEKQSIVDLESELLKNNIEPNKIRVAVIGSSECSICDEALNRVNKAVKNEKYITKDIMEKIEIVKYDVGTENGRVMAAIYNAPLDTYPTIIVHKGNKFIKKGWEYPYNKPAVGLTTSNIGDMISSIVNEDK